MSYLLGLFIVLALGFLSLRLLSKNNWPLMLQIFLSLLLGLAIVGHIGFYIHLLASQFNRWVIFVVVAVLLGLLIWLNKKIKPGPIFNFKPITTHELLALIPLGLLIIPLWIEAHYFPLGGWDAWSCWNLKAKFIFLGQQHWNNMFEDVLWRSNTHYPLLLPLINVWFWNLEGAAYPAAAMFNALLLTLVTAGILLFALLKTTKHLWLSIGLTVLGFGLPFAQTLSVSQYSDILLAACILAAFVCYFENEMILATVFIGCASFTKTEGLVASLILVVLMSAKNLKDKNYWLALVLAGLPTIIFTLFMAPHNVAFVNGLTSAARPSTTSRLLMILTYPFFEFISFKWQGLWLIALAGLMVGFKNAFSQPLKICGLFLLAYLGVVCAYYYVNTFFDIAWWLQNTFSRIIFALIPTLLWWTGASLKKDA